VRRPLHEIFQHIVQIELRSLCQRTGEQFFVEQLPRRAEAREIMLAGMGVGEQFRQQVQIAVFLLQGRYVQDQCLRALTPADEPLECRRRNRFQRAARHRRTGLIFGQVTAALMQQTFEARNDGLQLADLQRRVRIRMRIEFNIP
jgi:hypothetical protein